MDPLTLLLVALAAGAATAGNAVVGEAAKKAYKKLKRRLASRGAAAQDATDALARVEQRPDSDARRDVLREELEALGAHRDDRLLQLAQSLVDLLQQQGQVPRHLAQTLQSGSGAIAQGAGAMAVGAGGALIAGNFKGNLYVGAPPTDRAQILTVYRQCLAQACAHLPLRSVDLGASDPTAAQKQLDLDRVYIGLDTTARVETKRQPDSGTARRVRDLKQLADEDSRPVAALEAAASHRRLVFLGDPGSGKSTFLSHLSFCLARHGLEPAAGWLARLPSWPAPEGDLVPVPIILRDFARQLPNPLPKAEPHHLWDFVRERLQKQNLGFAADTLLEALDQGRALVLCDGLDEVASSAQRIFIRDAVHAFADRHGASRMIVTCRTFSYQDRRWQLPEAEFPAFTLAAFDEPKILRFITAWFEDLASIGTIKPDEAAPLAGSLQSAIRRPDLWGLAPNPLLLTVMALVHSHKGRLPDARAQLYEDTVDLLLWRWEQVKTGADDDAPGLRPLLRQVGRLDVDLKRVLWRLAFEAHRAGGAGDKLADIGELTLQNALVELDPSGSRDWAAQMIETIKQRAGLLLEREPQVYTFPHRTFQEHLAGAHLATQPNFAAEAAALVEAGAFWREVILLAVGKLVYVNGEVEKPLLLAATLCPESSEPGDAGWRKSGLAGDVLREIGLLRVRENSLGRELLPRVQQRLAALVGGGRLSPVERAAIGVTLGRLGDPRKGVGVRPDGVPDIDWIEIPAGRFTMGNDEPVAIYDDESPQFTCRLIKVLYRISRYPITVAQYECFVKAGGYAEREYWTAAGWAWRQKEQRTGPRDFSEPFQIPNHPRVGVSWFEAFAFCGWLSEQLGLAVSLPSEAQWERAARHTDGRVYPWGDAEECRLRCNMAETGIGHTSAVGAFPMGHAPGGVADMAGNVWEWCQTRWLDNYKGYESKAGSADDPVGEGARGRRGGSFFVDASGVRCANRNTNFPDSRIHFIGFRVVASPFSER